MVDKDKRDRMVEDVIRNFDFYKVYSVMRYLKWRWVGSKQSPTKEELYRTARFVLNEVKYSTEYRICSTGGFTAQYEPLEDGTLSLSFSVSEYSITEKYFEK